MTVAFFLVPFPSQASPPIAIEGTVSRQAEQLQLTYHLQEASRVNLPQPSDAPQRRHNLWEKTCFEFFLGLENTPQYWEFNLAPSGDWNVFQLADYRQGLTEEQEVTSLVSNIFHQSDPWQLQVSVDLSPLIAAQQSILLGITAVIQEPDQQSSYWALHHPLSEPDFHHRDGWLIRL